MDKASSPVLSVITVVFNDVKDIERTMQSVLNQSYPHIEYIVIDGGSTDGTIDLVKKYENRLAKFISEKDQGIYDAMNKGLSIARGDYVLFMNSGDEIYTQNTVEKIFDTASDADVYYGETEMYDEAGKRVGRRRHEAPKKLTWKSFRYGMSVSHQAIYIRRSLTSPFDLNYKLSSDIDWIIRVLRKADHIVNVRMMVAKYEVGGLSKKKHRESLKERFHIFTTYYGLIPNIINHGIIAIRLAFYYVWHGKTND